MRDKSSGSECPLTKYVAYLGCCLTAFAFAACGGGNSSTDVSAPPSSGSAITTVLVTPAVHTIVKGETHQFTAAAKDAKGDTIAGAAFTWTSSDASVASIDSSGLATGRLAGSTTITATSDGVESNDSTLTIIPAAVASITLTPSTSTIEAGQSQQFVATAKDATGTVIPGATFTWNSSNPAVASITSSGFAVGILAGGSNITATAGAVSSNPASLTVTPSSIKSISLSPLSQSIQTGQTQQFLATARDVNGNTIPNVAFTWILSGPTIASITSGGLATGLVPGATTITATSAGVSSNSSTLTVTRATVNSITVTPTTASIQTGQTQLFVATAKDAGGNPIPGVVFAWNSSDPTVASIDSTGIATAGPSAGTTLVTASAEGVTSSAGQLRVTATSSRVYSTTFTLSENPISEGGNWTNGKADGIDWSDVATTSGLAFGTQGGNDSCPVCYNDSTALLTGNWGPDQTVTATVHSVNQTSVWIEEVELRLRSSISAHSNTGYEILFRALKSDLSYVQIVRWNGPLGDFTYLAGIGNIGVGISDGDMVSASIIGNVITAYINGVLILTATDNTYPTGKPGMGFFLRGPSTLSGDFGFTSFSASD